MLVKAKWNVKDAAGWHRAGEVFETTEDLGESVEVMVPEIPKYQPPKKAAEEAPEKAEAPEEPVKPKTSRRKISK